MQKYANNNNKKHAGKTIASLKKKTGKVIATQKNRWVKQLQHEKNQRDKAITPQKQTGKAIATYTHTKKDGSSNCNPKKAMTNSYG